jgi:hypothetical protein
MSDHNVNDFGQFLPMLDADALHPLGESSFQVGMKSF